MLASAARQAARRSLAPTTRRAFSDAAAPSIKRDITRDTSRHITSDGRVSLKKHLMGERAEGGAVALCARSHHDYAVEAPAPRRSS